MKARDNSVGLNNCIKSSRNIAFSMIGGSLEIQKYFSNGFVV